MHMYYGAAISQLEQTKHWIKSAIKDIILYYTDHIVSWQLSYNSVL